MFKIIRVITVKKGSTLHIRPLSQFVVHNIFPLRLWGMNISVTNSALFMIIATTVLSIFFLCALRRPSVVPSRLQALAEWPFDMVASMIKDTNGVGGLPFVPLLTSVFLLIFMGNALGLMPFSFTFTSQLVVNLVLGLCVITAITIFGFVRQGFSFLRLFMPTGVPIWVLPVLVPVEIISYFLRPISLSMRLFANMVAGHCVLKICAYFTASMGVYGVLPMVANVALLGFEFFIAFLQAYVFVILSCIYLNDALHHH